jgi:hypothetical protein
MRSVLVFFSSYTSFRLVKMLIAHHCGFPIVDVARFIDILTPYYHHQSAGSLMVSQPISTTVISWSSLVIFFTSHARSSQPFVTYSIVIFFNRAQPLHFQAAVACIFFHKGQPVHYRNRYIFQSGVEFFTSAHYHSRYIFARPSMQFLAHFV